MAANEHPAFFDEEMAASYDERFSSLSAIMDALHLMMIGVLSKLPTNARVLSVGAGTGAEILALGAKFPDWSFTAVEPAPPMMEICQQKIVKAGLTNRVTFHQGYLDSLPPGEPYHVATSILVSQFLLALDERKQFFAGMAERLQPGGILISADLSCDLDGREEDLLEMWMNLLEIAGMPPDGRARIRQSYGKDVAVTAPEQIEALITAGGFAEPAIFFQCGLIRSWFAKRA